MGHSQSKNTNLNETAIKTLQPESASEDSKINALQPVVFNIAEFLPWQDRVNLRLVCKGCMMNYDTFEEVNHEPEESLNKKSIIDSDSKDSNISKLSTVDSEGSLVNNDKVNTCSNSESESSDSCSTTVVKVGRDGQEDNSNSSESDDVINTIRSPESELVPCNIRNKNTLSDLIWWRFLTKRLCKEHGLYLAPITNNSTLGQQQGSQCKDEEVDYWKTQFLRLYKMRNKFLIKDTIPVDAEDSDADILNKEVSTDSAANEFKIEVFIRVKGGKLGKDPSKNKDNNDDNNLNNDNEDSNERSVTLPLHQRVSLLRQCYNDLNGEGFQISQEEALKIVIRERGQIPVGDKVGGAFGNGGCKAKKRGSSSNSSAPESSEVTSGDTNSKKVVTDEEVFGNDDDTNHDDPNQNLTLNQLSNNKQDLSYDPTSLRPQILDTTDSTVLAVVPGVGIRQFCFDGVFKNQQSQNQVEDTTSSDQLKSIPATTLNSNNSQLHIYSQTTQPLVQDFLNGNTVSLICYGQTNSGKTYTSFGPSELIGNGLGCKNLEGLAPRICREVMEVVGQRQKSKKKKKKELNEKNDIEEELIQDFSISNLGNKDDDHSKLSTTVSDDDSESDNINHIPIPSFHFSQLSISYVEVYGNEVNDLLQQGAIVGQDQEGRYSNTRATDRVGHRYVLDGHTAVKVNSYEEIEQLLLEGDKCKRRASTEMNNRSTRAHTILILNLESQFKEENDYSTGITDHNTITNKLFLADLGGAEKISKSKADKNVRAPVMVVGGVEINRIGWQEYYENRERVQETLLINRGLLALKRVISALNDRVKGWREWKEKNDSGFACPPPRSIYVPYQDSKLTQILQSSLGNNGGNGANNQDSRTAIICCVCPADWNAQESVHTLRFAENCSSVNLQILREKMMKNNNNSDSNSSSDLNSTNTSSMTTSFRRALTTLDNEIDQLEKQIVLKERWETKIVEQRKDLDTIAGQFGDLDKEEVDFKEKMETVKVTVLTGAEEEHERLEECLKKRKQLQGLMGIGLATSQVKDSSESNSSDANLGGRDFRTMVYNQDSDKQSITKDFRNQGRFGKKMIARDFENLSVVADGLRYLFRKTKFGEEMCGETEETRGRRLPVNHRLLAGPGMKVVDEIQEVEEGSEAVVEDINSINEISESKSLNTNLNHYANTGESSLDQNFTSKYYELALRLKQEYEEAKLMINSNENNNSNSNHSFGKTVMDKILGWSKKFNENHDVGERDQVIRMLDRELPLLEGKDEI